MTRRALSWIFLFMACMLIAGCSAESIEEASKPVDISEPSVASSHYSDYDTLINLSSNTSISVGMSKEEMERVLGASSKSEQSGNAGEYWNTYGNGLVVNFKNNIAMRISVERAAQGYVTKKGNIAIGDQVEEVRKQFGQESIFLKGFNDLMYALIVRGDEVTTMKLPVESSVDTSELLDADIYVLEFRIDDQQHVSKISLVAKEVYLQPDAMDHS
jgi:hypothetical protein